ncbi:MAG: hypothetical protein H0T66_01580 [Geodermatophilaceae bacterium]|nr:hypothetical protein [Geodermatophilaceae bacterium]MDQ3455932.1 hypothetical protein [Actinomycetota bacterium]
MSDPAVPPRVRVDLSARRSVRLDRTVREIEEQTRVGEVLVQGLIRAQLGLALRLSVVVAALLGGLPLLFAVVPGLAAVEVFGLRLPWLLLGILAYPFLYFVARLYVRQAERNEQDFAEFVGGS